MQTVENVIEKISSESKPFRIQERKSPEIFECKKVNKRKGLKRLSPFLILAFLLPIFSVYSFIKGGSFLFQLALLFILEINILFADFAVWNYFCYKKITGIWIVESFIAFAIVYLMI